MNQTAPRYDIYAVIHKGLRAAMADTLDQVGRAGWDDAGSREPALAAVDELLPLCAGHLKHEDAFIHPAMEAVRPGSSTQTASSHRGHEQHIAELSALVQRIRAAAGAERHALGDRLYRELAAFVAENFEHMAVEESHNNAVLWAGYDDAQILDIEHRLVANIAPPKLMQYLRWMLPHANPAQRLAMLGGMREHAPAEAFDAVIDMLRGLLRPREWQGLSALLDPQPAG